MPADHFNNLQQPGWDMSELRPNVLYLASRSPYPATGGRERIIGQSIRFLAEKANLNLIVLCKKNESIDTDALMGMGCSSVEIAPMPEIWEIISNIMTRPRYSLQESLFFSGRAMTAIRTAAGSGIDVVVADMLRTGQYCESLEIPKILDLDDLLSDRYRQFLKNGYRNTIFGTFLGKIPSALRLVEPYFRRLVLKIESRRIAKRELAASSLFDVLLLTSETEAESLRAMSGRSEIYANPQAAELSKNQWRHVVRNDGAIDAFFIGNLKTSQNLEALRFLVAEVVPVTKAMGCHLTIHAVGGYDERARNVVADSPHIVLHGFVSDYSQIVEKCSAALLPIVEGTGVKTKVLDAMSLGMPVLTTPLGAEGLNVQHMSHLVIAHTAAEMADFIVFLSKDVELSNQLAVRSREYIARNHDPIVLGENFSRFVSMAIQRAAYRVGIQARLSAQAAEV
ncbi:glycosyltransferase family 4 protein [Paraburkholderia sp. GAS32]|jgi:glycosyltransferase involved in cell wall biosynthesis|uniref:glycosyltransferase family 4 protein n=1 Tax=Paraburkholderia sp. GAS32 TaxID=3035129 RepID=UPI003D2256EC